MKNGMGRTLLISGTALAVLIGLLNWKNVDDWLAQRNDDRLMIYCAAGLQEPVSAVAKEYEKRFHTTIEFKYAGSGELLSNMRAASAGDIYVAASTAYIDDARRLGLVEESVPLATQAVVVAVHKENPKEIHSLDDLVRDDVRVSIADPEVAAISRVAKRLLDAADAPTPTWAELWDAKIVSRATVNEVANDVKTDAADAGLVWDATAGQYPELAAVTHPVFQAGPKQIVAAVLSDSKQPTAALRFLRFLSARDEGLKHFGRLGYDVVRGDRWSDRPQLSVFIGGVNRTAVDPIIRQFERREGVTVLPTYNGCGILVGQMKAGETPDVYFACDTSFMDDVADRFDPAAAVSSTDMVLIVLAGNPRKIAGLADLAREDVKVGICNPKFSALGHLCQVLLQQEKYGLWDKVYANTRDNPPSADSLVSSVAIGSLDAAIVYRANTVAQRAKLQIIEIDDPGAAATQPIAVSTDSDNHFLAERLMRRIRSASSKQNFEDAGFNWQGETE